MVELNKGAVTRLENDKTRAKQMSMPGNQAAQQALRHQVSGVKKGGNPVGVSNYGQVLQPASNNAIPTGGPTDLPPQPDFDPAVFKQDVADSILGSVKTHQFLNSAAAKDAKTSVELKEIFNQFNPNKKPDPRSMVDRVVDRMGLDRNEKSS